VPAQGKRTKAGKGRKAAQSSGGRGTAPKPPKKGGDSVSSGKAFPKKPSVLLPLLAVWLMVVVTLAGLIYWAKGNPSGSGGTPQEAPSIPKQAAAPAPQATRPAAVPPVASEKHDYVAKPQLPPASASQTREKAPPPPQPVVPPPPLARAAIVIDDLGQDLQMAERFLAVPLPLTYSILPFQPHSREIAHLARYHQREVLLHLPMEPKGFPKTRPGPGALLVSMSKSALRQTLREALDATPFVAGVNNHMGSRFTEHAELMGVLFAELRQRDLYFLDSYTSEKSVCTALASRHRVPFLRRQVFLDHENSEAFVRAQIRALIRKARVEGSAVAIGHPREATLKALLDMAGRFQEEGVLVVPSGELLPRERNRQSPVGKEDPNREGLSPQRGSSTGAS